MATTGQLWPASSTADAIGTTILSGTATPTGATGVVGDYYLDTDDHILYGPKREASPDEYVVPTPLDTAIGGTGAVAGMKHRFTSPGFVRGIRVFVASAATGTGSEVYLFSNTGTMLASKDASAFTINAWNTVLFDTPVPVVVNTTYIAAVWYPTGSKNVSGDSGLYPGQTSGHVRLLGTDEDGVQGTYSTTRDTCPLTSMGMDKMGIAAVFAESSSPWSVAVQTLDATKWTMWSGTQAAYDAITTKDPNTLYVVV